jgi:hypothetical protein
VFRHPVVSFLFGFGGTHLSAAPEPGSFLLSLGRETLLGGIVRRRQ